MSYFIFIQLSAVYRRGHLAEKIQQSQGQNEVDDGHRYEMNVLRHDMRVVKIAIPDQEDQGVGKDIQHLICKIQCHNEVDQSEMQMH